MGKEGVGMFTKKAIVCGVLALFVLLSAGCQTAKGVAGGAAEGIAKDSKDFGSAIMVADAWIRKNLW